MQFGLGVLALSPNAFWAMRFPEFMAAWRGWATANGVDQAGSDRMTTADADDLRALIASV